LVWRSCVLGYAEGATVRTILTYGGMYFARSLFRNSVNRTALPYSMGAVE
jgi:hypothetical protein